MRRVATSWEMWKWSMRFEAMPDGADDANVLGKEEE
jgi:hypothetical protein